MEAVCGNTRQARATDMSIFIIIALSAVDIGDVKMVVSLQGGYIMLGVNGNIYGQEYRTTSFTLSKK